MGDGRDEIAPAVDAIRSTLEQEDAAELLDGYFAPGAFTGAHFERLDGGGDRPEVANVFTAADVASVALLSVPLEGSIVQWLLVDAADQLASLLADVPMADLATAEGREALSDDGKAAELYELLRGRDKIGSTKASKLMARKRPALVPIRDTVVSAHLGDPHRWWPVWRAAMGDDDVVARLDELRAASGVPELTRLRAADIVLWRAAERA